MLYRHLPPLNNLRGIINVRLHPLLDCTKRVAMENKHIIEHLRSMAKKKSKPSEILRYLTVDLKMTDQVNIMKLFSKAFDVTLGEVTMIAAWWHEGSVELNDNDIDAYLMPMVKNFLAT